jgi:hypothetical protein
MDCRLKAGDPDAWECVRKGGLPRFLLARALPMYGLPFALLMALHAPQASWLAEGVAFTLRMTVFGVCMGCFAFRLDEAAYRKRQRRLAGLAAAPVAASGRRASQLPSALPSQDVAKDAPAG